MKGSKKQATREATPKAGMPRQPRARAARPNAADDRDREIAGLRSEKTATAEILRIIASSLTDEQPVFDAIVHSAQRLLRGHTSTIRRLVNGHLVSVAFTATTLEGDRVEGARGPYPAARAAIALFEGKPWIVTDVPADPELPLEARQQAEARGYRSVLGVPLVRAHEVIGALFVSRREAGGFTNDEVALLQTFADQAVIAIENVRLFTELDAKNRTLTSALDQQTATGEILRIIPSSPTDAQPVFEAIVQSAVRLLRSGGGVLTRKVGDRIELGALVSDEDAAAEAALRAVFPLELRSAGIHAAAVRTRAPLNIPDADTDPRLGESGRTHARVRGYRSLAVVPLLRQDEAVGTIAVSRTEPGGFTDDEVSLLQTFADQAVIALENVRLFTELRDNNEALTRANAQVTEALEQQTATAEILRVIASTPTDVQPVFETIVRSAVQLCRGLFGTVWQFDGELIHQVAQHNYTPEALELVRQIYPSRPSRKHGSARAILERRLVHIPDVELDTEFELHTLSRRVGWRSGLFIPMLRGEHAIGAIGVTRAAPGRFSDSDIALLETFARQAVIAIENVRLFTELQERTAQLQVAHRHKDEFLANMSHELRTPLNGIIGFSEVMLERMFGEINEKQEEYLGDILSSGRHLLSLINDILDLSKIEAGKMELELTEFDAPTAIDNAMMLMRERAARRGQILERSLDPALGQMRADERKFKQVLLNLLSNAVKFTPEGGRISVTAGVVNGEAVVSVTDTGIGIAPEHQGLVFEEFRQVGHADKKAEGTGLGLTLCRKFIELHGGRISATSELGNGSTFTFALPLGT